MHFNALSKTSVEILAFLSSSLRESFTVRQIAHGIGQDYRITYEMTMRLIKGRYVIAEKRRRPVTYCKLNIKGNAAILAYIEGIRASRFLARHRDIDVVLKALSERIATPFFTMILFGSHIKGTASRRSDLDALFIVPDRKRETDISSAVASVERTTPYGIHEVILTNDDFTTLLKEGATNVAWEALENRIVPYGAEPLFKMLEKVI